MVLEIKEEIEAGNDVEMTILFLEQEGQVDEGRGGSKVHKEGLTWVNLVYINKHDFYRNGREMSF